MLRTAVVSLGRIRTSLPMQMQTAGENVLERRVGQGLLERPRPRLPALQGAARSSKLWRGRVPACVGGAPARPRGMLGPGLSWSLSRACVHGPLASAEVGGFCLCPFKPAGPLPRCLGHFLCLMCSHFCGKREPTCAAPYAQGPEVPCSAARGAELARVCCGLFWPLPTWGMRWSLGGLWPVLRGTVAPLTSTRTG